MSKERELLRRVKVLLECSNMEPLQDQADIIIKEIQQLLAQPEQEQEPVAWKVVDRTTGDFMFSRVKPMGRSYKYDVVIPLYTAPTARKHLTGIEISQGFKGDDDATHPYSYWAGINFAEKHHGIGGGNEHR